MSTRGNAVSQDGLDNFPRALRQRAFRSARWVAGLAFFKSAALIAACYFRHTQDLIPSIVAVLLSERALSSRKECGSLGKYRDGLHRRLAAPRFWKILWSDFKKLPHIIIKCLLVRPRSAQTPT
jgi:hypothetical protein